MVDRNGIAKGASGCAMTKLGCAFTSSGAPTSSISSGRRGCCAEAVPKVITVKPQPKMAANQCRVVIFFVFIFLFEAGLLNCINCNPVPRGTRHVLLNGLGLAIDEVIHHDDVMLAIIIRSRGNVAGCDPDTGDACVVKHDAEEGEASVTRRGRDEAA